MQGRIQQKSNRENAQQLQSPELNPTEILWLKILLNQSNVGAF